MFEAGVLTGFVIGIVATYLVTRHFFMPKYVAEQEQAWLNQRTSLISGFDEEKQNLTENCEQEKAGTLDLAAEMVAAKNALIFQVMGLLVTRHVGTAVKLKYVDRVFNEDENSVVLYFQAGSSDRAYKTALGIQPMIDDLLEEVRRTLNFKHKLFGKIQGGKL